jgi:phosphosulfolactate phosphohydrolase-like enzyme
MCVAQGVTAITPDLFANKISQVIRNTMSYIDIALFVAMLNAFVLVWMLLTRAFDRVIIMRGKDISKKAAKNRKLILERLRRVAAVVLILASMGFSTIIVIGTVLYVLGSTVRVIPQ